MYPDYVLRRPNDFEGLSIIYLVVGAQSASFPTIGDSKSSL